MLPPSPEIVTPIVSHLLCRRDKNYTCKVQLIIPFQNALKINIAHNQKFVVWSGSLKLLQLLLTIASVWPGSTVKETSLKMGFLKTNKEKEGRVNHIVWHVFFFLGGYIPCDVFKFRFERENVFYSQCILLEYGENKLEFNFSLSSFVLNYMKS